ncbi:hybrid sensor histidine kinase/response regulator [Woodsholea maritima]|uniref:hybrid sensor histidine kinase/response regulator n=1 Tax=Woodsholea maritima TaxID=240237 RepID=UPI00036E9D7D|nr:hybrid sensor histidine kinase/response regulator [Woodsholea maritima]
MKSVKTAQTSAEKALEQRIRDARYRLVAEGALQSGPLNIVNGAVLMGFFYTDVAWWLRLGWLAMMTVAVAGRVLTMRRAMKEDRAPTPMEMRIYTILSGLVGLVWGSSLFLLPSYANPLAWQCTMLILAGMAAGAALSSAPEPRVVAAYNLPALGLLTVFLGLQQTYLHGVMAGLTILFFFVMQRLAWTNSRYLVDAVKSRTSLEDTQRRSEAQSEALLRLAEEHEEAARRAEESAKKNAAVLVNMSHDLRGPLSEVLGVTDILKRANLDAENASMVEMMAGSGQQLSYLIHDVLDYARIQAGQMELYLSDITCETLGEHLRRHGEPRAKSKGIRFSVKVTGDTERAMRMDAQRVEQILKLFINNAVRFTESGEVAVMVHVESQHQELARLHVEVRDSGVGVPPALRAHLFEAFQREELDDEMREAGTGLGLLLCKQLANFMRGDVGYRPAPGGGSIMWLDLPLRYSSRLDRYCDNETMSLAKRRLRVLVAESDDVRATVLRGHLQVINCGVTSVTRVEDVLQALRSSAFDAVVLGPVVESVASEGVAEQIRAMASTAALTPIIRLVRDLGEPIRHQGHDYELALPIVSDDLTRALNLATGDGLTSTHMIAKTA